MNRKFLYIQTIADCGSLLKASEMLYISPSALSKYVHNLEIELGVPLFDRAGKQFKLSYAGERFLHWQKCISNIQEEMLTEFSGLSSSCTGRLRIGLQLTNTTLFTKQILPAFFAKYPLFKIEILEDTSTVLRHMIEDDTLDLAILPQAMANKKLVSYFLTDGHPVLAVTKTSSLLNQTQNNALFPYPWIDCAELKDENFILPFPEQEVYSQFLFFKSMCGFEPRINIQARSIGTIISCVEQGLGITVTQDKIIKSNCDLDNIALLSFGEQLNTEPQVLVHHKDHYLSQALQDLINLCTEAYSSL